MPASVFITQDMSDYEVPLFIIGIQADQTMLLTNVIVIVIRQVSQMPSFSQGQLQRARTIRAVFLKHW